MKRLLIAALRTYQTISRTGVRSPFLFGAYSGCRSWPTCSDFAISVIGHEGAIRGSVKAIARVLQCNPLIRMRYR